MTVMLDCDTARRAPMSATRGANVGHGLAAPAGILGRAHVDREPAFPGDDIDGAGERLDAPDGAHQVRFL